MQLHAETIAIVLFWLAFAVPAYSYFFFPMVLHTLARLRDKHFASDVDNEPPVTLLISAYNEARAIEGKLENSLALDYPPDKLQIIVINDGSSDGTDDIVERYTARGITHHRVEGRVGKNVAINKTWSMVKGEVVVFSDANSLYGKDAIRRMVSHFADERVGCVCGELRYVDAGTGTARGEDLYWKYEQYLKRLESRMGQVLVLNGSIFAIRQGVFRELHSRIANDFQIAVDVASQGLSIIYEPDAVAREKAATSARDEFNRKTRIIARGFQGFWHYLREFHGVRRFLLFSHKFLRWTIWLAMAVGFAANALLLDHTFFRWTFAGQVLFYALALAGPLLVRLRIRVLAIPYYFCMINVAAFVGFWKFMTRRQQGSWEPPSSAR